MNNDKLANTLGRIESKIDGLHDDIVELKEADDKLHDRISNKDINVRKLEGRVSKIESIVATIRWVIGTAIAGAVAIFTYFQTRN